VIETVAVATNSQVRPLARREDTSVEGIVTLVRDYAKQETLGPLHGAGRWLGFGVAGAVLLGGGLTLVFLGLLRLIQTEWGRSSSGSLSWLPYLLVLIVCIVAIGVAVSRINKPSLNKETE
jgi:hypothetical protein